MKKKSGNSWQADHSRFKRKRKIKLALFVLGGVLLTILSGNFVRLVNNLFTPVSSSFEKRAYLWDGQYNLNLIYKNKENISLFVINPKEFKVSGLEIPSNAFIDVPGGFGSWELRSIFDLGGGDSSKGSKLLKSSLSLFFGLPVDGFLESGEYESSEVFESLSKNPFSFTNWLGKIDSDLTPLELIRLYVFLQQVRSDKIENLSLLKLSVLESINLPDGSSVYLPNSRLDSFIIENLSDLGIKNEQKTIAVFNGTNTPGLAQKFGRLINNMGGNVVISGNTEEKFKYSLVYGEESDTKKRLAQLFSSKNVILDSKPTSRAQITIILGEDLAQ